MNNAIHKSGVSEVFCDLVGAALIVEFHECFKVPSVLPLDEALFGLELAIEGLPNSVVVVVLIFVTNLVVVACQPE